MSDFRENDQQDSGWRDKVELVVGAVEGVLVSALAAEVVDAVEGMAGSKTG
jgi:hypothetical protein